MLSGSKLVLMCRVQMLSSLVHNFPVLVNEVPSARSLMQSCPRKEAMARRGRLRQGGSAASHCGGDSNAHTAHPYTDYP